MRKTITVAVVAMLVAAGVVMAQGAASGQGTISGDGSNAPPEVFVRGTVTSISGSVVLVEEDPSAESGDKGYFAVTDETEITRQQGGGSVPAALEDLEVGQSVEAIYAGGVAESYPTQGNAGSIEILEETGPAPEETATLSFELTVEGEPPESAAFFGFIPAEGGIYAPLSDPDGDALYAGSVEVDRFGPRPRPVPPGTEPVSLPVQIVHSTGVIEDFGLIKIDGDRLFSASVSFEDDPGGTGNGGFGSSSDPGETRALPYTGGTPPLPGIAAACALLIGVLSVRRLAR